MNATHQTTAGELAPRRPASAVERLYRRLLLSRLCKLATGTIALREGGEKTVLGRPDDAGLRCELTVRDGRFFRDVVRGGSIGAAESYVRGDWSADDLTTLIRILARDARIGEQIDGTLAWLERSFEQSDWKKRSSIV